jgi:hypothetical protein
MPVGASRQRPSTFTVWVERHRHCLDSKVAESGTGIRSTVLDLVVKAQNRPYARSMATGIFLAILCGFLGLIIYYEMTQDETPFKL